MPSMSLLADLENPELFVVDPEAAVIDEHTAYESGPDGKPTEKVLREYTKGFLEELAANTNELDRQGRPCAMTIGHTVDGAPETEQPPIVGYWRQMRVDWSPTLNRWVIKATPYVRKDCYAEAKSYPRVSVEAWRLKKILDPIAILRRTPERPMQWTHAMQGRWSGGLDDEHYRYSMEANVGEEPSEIPGAKPTGADPTAPPNAQEPNDQDVDKFMATCQRAMPHLKGYHDKFMAAAMAPAAGPQSEIPGGPTVPEQTPFQMPKEWTDKFSALETELTAAKTELAATKASGAALAATLQGMTAVAVERERRAQLDKFAAVIPDMDAEVKDALTLTPDQFAAHVKRLERVAGYQHDPADRERFIPAVEPTRGGANGFTSAHSEKAQQFMIDHHAEFEREKLTGDERWSRALKFATTDGKTP